MLTELAIRKLKAREDRIEIWDDKLSGFGMRVSPAGTKSFVLMYYLAGRKRRLTLGRYPMLSLSEARRRALDALTKVAGGHDPQHGFASPDRSHAFASVVDEFVRMHCARHNRTSHAQETARLLQKRFVTQWRNRDIREIGRTDVLRLLDDAVDAGAPSAANHALAAVRKLFNWSVERGILTTNPCAGISRPAPVVSRDRVLSEPEIVAVWRASGALGAPFEQIIRLLILTAQRRGEVVALRWSELDWTETAWSLPPERTKGGRAHVVPLSQLAMTVLGSVLRIHDEFLFPARGNAAANPSGFSKMKRRLDALSGVTDWTLHDLRRTAATHMARLGVAPHVVERILNHATGTLGGVAGIYNRFHYLPEMRAALELWAAHVEFVTKTAN